MTYIGGTVYAPAVFDLEGFKEVFDRLAKATLEVDEPSALGKGTGSDRTDVLVRIKTVFIEEGTLAPLESALSMLTFGITITIEAVGSEPLHPKAEFADRLAQAVQGELERQATANSIREQIIERDAHDQYLAGMSTDQLRSAGYYNEAAERERQEYGSYDNDWYG